MKVSCGIGEVVMGDASNHTSGPALCYVRNDLPFQVQGSITVEVVRFRDGGSVQLSAFNYTLSAGAGTIEFFCATADGLGIESPADCHDLSEMVSGFSGCEKIGADCFLNVSWSFIRENSGTVKSFQNILPLASPVNFNLMPSTVSASVAQGDTDPVITVTSESVGVTAYVWLSTAASGRFESNAFWLGPGETKNVSFRSFESSCNRSQLVATLRLEHLQQMLSRR